MGAVVKKKKKKNIYIYAYIHTPEKMLKKKSVGLSSPVFFGLLLYTHLHLQMYIFSGILTSLLLILQFLLILCSLMAVLKGNIHFTKRNEIKGCSTS